MQRSHCLNCNTAIYPRQKFCTHCGQRSDIDRLTFKHLFVDFFHNVFNLEKGLFRLAKGLLLAPGTTVNAIVGGKRKYYLNPFTFVALCIALVLLLNNWLRPFGDITKADPRWLAAQSIIIQAQYQIDLMNFKYMNLVTVLMSPWFACCLWLFFRKRDRNVAEITIAVMLFIAFVTVLEMMVMGPLRAAIGNYDLFYLLLWSDLLLQTLYITWGLYSFFNYRSLPGFLKVLGVVCLAGVAGYILEVAIVSILIVKGII